MSETDAAVRVPESTIEAFERGVFERLGVPPETAGLAVRSLLDASLMGVDTHGVEALDMYVNHLRAGGLDPNPKAVLIDERGGLGLWDMQHGFGLANARRIMARAVERAREHGVYLATCRHTNHIGACGVYGKMAADRGLIGMVSQQSRASLAPWGGKEKRVGTSPVAFTAPVEGGFPFCYDASFAMITGAGIKAHIRAGTPLPEGVMMDAEGNPTTDPEKAWTGNAMPIGGHKGVGLAMAMEVLSAVLSGNVFSCEIPSIVSNPEKTASSSVFMLAVDPGLIMDPKEFGRAMRRYVEYVESSPPQHASSRPRYPGRQEGGCWQDREANGIPVRPDALKRFDEIADSLEIPHLTR